MKAYIKAISYYLPKNILTNQDLAKEFPEWTAEKIAKKIGIKERHIASKNETATDMAAKAAEKLFQEHKVDRASIDFVLLCTQSPDYFLPTSACLIQSKLNLNTSCGALDFNLGCSGFIYGLSLAKGLIFGGIAKNILVITSETYSKHIHSNDKGNRTIFGDGAAASLISTEGYAEIKDFSLGTDGRGSENLIVKSGGFRNKEKLNDLVYNESENPLSSDFLYMNGAKIFNFTADAVPVLVEDVIGKNHLRQDQVDLFVFHQANKYMINYLRKLLGIEKIKFFEFIENVGNTVSSTIPIALYEAKKEGVLKGNILLAGFGVGYSWGGVMLKIS